VTASRGHILIAAALGATLNPLNSTMIAVALPAIGRDFGAEASSVTVLVVTVYLIATLVCQMPSGSIADRAGYARALSWGRWIFAAGAAAGAFAPALSVVVLGRVLMAAGGALMVPTAMALVRVEIPAERRPRAFGTLGAALGAAAAIGPVIGGWMAPLLGWRWLFAINLPVLAASWLLQPRRRRSSDGVEDEPRTRNIATPPPFDWLGGALTGVVLVLLTMATRASGTAAYGMAATAIVTGGLLVYHEQRVAAPVFDTHLFTQPVFMASAGVIGLQNLAMYSLLIELPFLFSGSANSRIGLSIGAMTAAMAMTSPLGGRLAERFGTRLVVMTGAVAGAAGVLAIVRLGGGASATEVGARLLLVGLGLGLSTGPSQAAGLSAVAGEKSGVAAATMSMIRYVGSIAGTVILGYTLVRGTDGASRQQTALFIFAGAFLVSGALAVVLPGVTSRS
jgi:MFS family permease